ncbi:MAG: hypothetical protein KGH98_03860 [Candidatus Micrarchaeota archaeon]|nr:hypothetical protein [Candidatus Micrarchaeota archaeon]
MEIGKRAGSLPEGVKKMDDRIVLAFIGSKGNVSDIQLMAAEELLERNALGHSGIARAIDSADRLIDRGLVRELNPFKEKGIGICVYELTPNGVAEYEKEIFGK